MAAARVGRLAESHAHESVRGSLALVALLILGCGNTAVRSAETPLAGPRRTCRDEAPAVGSQSQSPHAWPNIAALATIVREHRPATSAVQLDGAPVGIPVDWRTLPMTAVLWEGVRLSDPMLIDGSLVALADQRHALVGHDARTGVERWRVRLEPEISERPYAIAGCGRVVLFDARRVAGIDPASGSVVWEIPLDANRNSEMAHPGSARIHGCRLVFQVADNVMRLADGFDSSRLRVVDVVSGAIVSRPTCPAPCTIVSTEDNGILVNTSEQQRLLFPWAAAQSIQLPASTSALAGDVALAVVDGALEGRDRSSGAVRWRSTLGGLLARVGDDILALDPDADAIVRISLATGAEVWRTSVSHELAVGIGRNDGRTHDARRLVIGSRVAPQFLIEVDLATGNIRSLRISAVGPAELALEGDLLALHGHTRTAVVDLTLDAPALRERFTLEDDVARTIAELEVTPPARSSLLDASPWAYPMGQDEALKWLARLEPLTGDVANSAGVAESLERAASRLGAITDPAIATNSAVGVLERTYGCAPTARRARARTRAAEFIAPGFHARRADELARETIAWLDVLETRHASGASDEDAEEGALAWAAILASRDALLRASPSPAPLRALAEAVARHAPRSTRSAPECVPSEADAVRAAALRWGYELSHSPRAVVWVPAARCVHVQTLGGVLDVVSSSVEPTAPWVQVSEPRRVSERDHLTLPWPDAPARVVAVTSHSGPLNAQCDLLLVQLVAGEWRVVWSTMLWVA